MLSTEQNQTHSDARPADVPAVKCVPFSPLPAAPVLLCNTEDYTYNDRSGQSALGDAKKNMALTRSIT